MQILTKSVFAHFDQIFCVSDEGAAEKMKEILTPISKEYQEAASKDDSPQDLFFFIAPSKGSNMVDSLCEFLNVNPKEKSLFIVDVPAGEIYLSNSCKEAPVKEDVLKFIRDYKQGVLVPKNIRS